MVLGSEFFPIQRNAPEMTTAPIKGAVGDLYGAGLTVR
ncbi:hypothetical protein SMB34_19740 [Thalassospira permensis NBRC 106175]|uniref:Uncharacterized protein n=1 Tax=Thalassospira permensis NBRC 106175 TaxID=1353532 RepID=A0ABR4TLK4_9PROT|nr:hypothetical protein SMB34_19740 [Thalassospira permensis NBRC 106175]